MTDLDYLKELQLKLEQIHSLVIHNMNEGLLVVGNDGKIILTNPRAESILERDVDSLEGCPFARLFYGDEKNDDFNQVILDVIYDKEKVHNRHVQLVTDSGVKQLNVISSGLFDGERVIGVIVVLSDITDLIEIKLKNEYVKKALTKYLSESVAEQILNSAEGLEIGGKKEEITILMSDLRGFTAMCEEISPDVLMDVLNHYLKVMGEIIRKQSGTVIEYVGDGILAIFGAPVHSATHARDAVVCAIKMQQAMLSVNFWNKTHGYPKLHMGIGINTGEAVVGNMGSEYTMKYNVIGSSVNLCGRLESYTVNEQIFISPSTKAQISEELKIDDTITITPKGIKEPMEIYSVYGIGGDINISYNKNNEELIPLPAPVMVKIAKMEDKHVSDLLLDGKILAYSPSMLLFYSDSEFMLMDNIVFKHNNEDIYGKITRKQEDNWIIKITSGKFEI